MIFGSSRAKTVVSMVRRQVSHDEGPGSPDAGSQHDDPRPVGHERGPGENSLTFPDLPRLELDQLLSQLVERAEEVMATQGRLRGLLRANQLIIGDLGLP